MSTRGWYEYYVMDGETGKRSLSMQFYKWGDATPEEALYEWKLLQGQIDRAGGLLPVSWLDDLLRDQLGEIYSGLPPHFSVAAFLFLIQRADEERSPFRQPDYLRLPKEQRPDYRLGFAVGKAMALNNFQPRKHPDPLLGSVLFFIATGHFVRPWKDFALNWSVLHWLQYLTQITLETDMGSIAGHLRKPAWVSYVHRFFIWVDPREPFRINRLAVQFCESNGADLLTELDGRQFKPGDTAAYDCEEVDKLRQQIEDFGVDIYALDESEADFTVSEDCFWELACLERPIRVDRIQPSGVAG